MFQYFGRVLLSALFVMASALPFVAAGTPDAVNDTVTVRKDTKTDINVLANDTGSSFGPGVVGVTQPANGSVRVVAGKVRYVPNPGYIGTDSFSYTVRNGAKFSYVQRGPVRFVTSAENGNKGAVTVQASGWGSAMAAGPNANQFYLLTDRGPNADGTGDTNKTFPVPDFNPKMGLFERVADGTFALKQTINLKRPDGVTLLTGLPNPVNTSGLETASLVGGGAVTLVPPGSAQGQDVFGIDPEGLAFVSGGFWVSDEYGPQLVKFDLNGVEQERLNPFNLNTQGRKIPRILGERRPNRGMEGLCATPSGKLVGIMQSALRINNAGTGQSISNGNNNKTPVLRILRYDPVTGGSEQFIYLMDNTANTNQMRVSEITCVNEDKFLVLERDDNAPEADSDGTGNSGGPYKVIYEIDLTKSLDSSGAVDAVNPPTDVNGGRDQTTGALIPYTPGDPDGDPGTAANKVKQWKRASNSAINTLEVLCQQQDAAQSLTILHALQNPVTSAAEPVRPVAKTAFFNYFNELGTAYPHTKTEGIVVLERNGLGDTATKIALVNDDDFGIDVDTGSSNTIKTNINASGVQTFNEIVEIDLTTVATDTATVNITVQDQVAQVVAVADGVVVKPLFTVGDSVNTKLDGVTPYRMVGIPDGLGAFKNTDNTFTLVMHHEVGSASGIVREHGSKGAFVSRWNIDRTTFKVNSIADHNATPKSIFTTTNGNGSVAGTALYSRLCSADLPAATAFFNSTSGKGTSNRIFMGGEENGTEGRAFAHVVSGPSMGFSYELPHLGKFSWENSIANPFAQDKTLVIGTDDATPGQVYLYVGDKRTTGNEVEKAGLVGGKLFGVRANSKATEDRLTGIGSAKDTAVPFTLVDLGDVSTKTGAQLQTASVAGGVTEFLRPEDGAWDPNNPADFYFVTTDRYDSIKNVSTGTQVGRSRLYRLRFSNLAQPELGGTITVLIDGSENPGPNMMDNLCVDKLGRVIIQEDIGGQAASGKIWSYSLSSKKLTLLAKHDPAIFGDVTESSLTLPIAGFNNDEESSGIIDASEILGTGWYLLDVEAHVTANDTELVEKGQLLAMFIPSSTDETNPSNSTPYIVPVANGVKTKAIFTVGETANLKPDGITPYRMVGIPDGLGAYDNNDGTFTLAIGHELGSTEGVFRAHGSKGAFVSKWTIKKDTLQVRSIEDLNPNNTSIFTSTNGNGTIAGTALYGRFCSADLPAATAFFNPSSGLGTSARLFMNGEEAGNEGRAFAHILTGANAGKSHELPRLGKFSWENSVACPLAQDTTIVIGTDDSTPGQVYVYVGTKGNSGTDVDKAGLTNGNLYGVLANATAVEDRTTGVGLAKGVAGPFTLFNLTNVSALTGAQLETNSGTSVTKFLRPEDGAWDPNNPNDFYFVTTDRFDQIKNDGVGTQVGRSRLWKMHFADLANPTSPTRIVNSVVVDTSAITMLLDGSENPGPNMMDNMTVDRFGRIFLQEDPGGQNHSARIWMYTIATGSLIEIAKHDSARFGDLVNGTVVPATAPFNNDEESSGIIDAGSLLGDGWYLLDVQAHAANPDSELVQYGQLLAMFVPTILPPTISPIADQITNEDTATGAIPFTVTAGSFAITTVTAVSSNKTLVPDASAVVAGTTQSRTITLTPAANQNGLTTITVTATDAGGQSMSTSFTLTVQPVPDLPVITSAASATPNPAGPTQTITFTIAATGAQSIEWNFGDGTPVGSGAMVTHAYTAEGVFNVIVKVTGTEGISTSNVTVIIANESNPTGGQGDFDGDGVSNDLDDDDDNDGYSDKIETAMGGNPLNATVTPGNKPAITDANTVAPRMIKLSIKLAFTTNGDALTLSGILPGSTGASDVIVDVGGNVQSFTLTKGKSPKDKSKSLSLAKDKLTMKLNKVTLAPDFADEGLTNGSFSGEIVNIGVSVIANGKLFEAELSKEYSAKGGKGSVK